MRRNSMCEPTCFDCKAFYLLARITSWHKNSGDKVRLNASKYTTNRTAQSSLRLEDTPFHKSQSEKIVVIRSYLGDAHNP